MTRADPGITMTPIGDSSVATGALPEGSLAISQANREAWQAIIDHKLIEWGRYPERLEENELIPPTPESIRVACDKARDMRDAGDAAPQRVVPDGDGGIVFERWDGPMSEALEISEDGAVEYVCTQGTTVIDRRRVQ